MNKEWKTKWIAALRSGDYQQDQGQLAEVFITDSGEVESRGYCCLGVLCEIHSDVTEKKADRGGVGCIEYIYKTSTSSGNLPRELRCDLDIRLVDEERLINMNDASGESSSSPLEESTIYENEYPNTLTFDEIADYIEKEM